MAYRRIKASDFIGQRFGRLVGLREMPKRMRGKPTFEFQCDCGTVKELVPYPVRDGLVVSCGCQMRERARMLGATINLRHGDSRNGRRAKEYGIYRTMLNRCYDANTEKFPMYGGRGITVCDRWRCKLGYENFLHDMGRKPVGLSLDRIDPNGPYSPDNCRWASAREQSNNTRRNRLIEFGGRTQTLAQWSDEVGIRAILIHLRLKAGWTLDDALFKPVRNCKGTSVSCTQVSRRSGTAEYGAWRHMIRRCTDPNNIAYQNYGGRGIAVCEEWLESYETFLRDVGPKPHPRFSLDRINNDGGYCPENVRWADRLTQNRNKRYARTGRRAA